MSPGLPRSEKESFFNPFYQQDILSASQFTPEKISWLAVSYLNSCATSPKILKLHLNMVRGLLERHESKFQRALEILPGSLAWGVILFPRINN